MSAKLSRFSFLTVTGREGVHFTAPFIGELERHMSQSTDTNDANTSSRGHVVNQQRRKDRNAAAQERSYFCHIQRLRQRTNPGPLRSNTIREAAVASDNGALSSGAKVMVAGKTLVAREAAASG